MAEPLTCVDADGFLGMHHGDPVVRRDWKSFFVRHAERDLLMSLEQVGLCDERVWRTPRYVQDAYYPFMDMLHSVARIHRVGYADADLAAALEDSDLTGLTVGRRLLMAFTRRHEATLVTRDPDLLAHPGLAVRRLEPGDDNDRFAPDLEVLYARSCSVPLIAAAQQDAAAGVAS